MLFSRWKEICSTPLRNAIALERSLILNLCERKVMRGMDLIEVARQCPDLTVSIRLGDLIEANQSLVEEAWLPHTAIRRRQETLPSVRHPTAPEPLMLHSAKR